MKKALLAGWLFLTVWAPLWGQDGGNAVVEFLQAVHNGVKPGQTFLIPESDLNAFIRQQIEQARVAAVESVSVKLSAGTFDARIVVDGDKLQLEQGVGSVLKSMFTGKQVLEVEGSVRGEAGMVHYTTQSASLNGIPLPASVVDLILSSIGKEQQPPFDPSQPFPLPQGIKTLTVEPGAVRLTS
ncbi:MAG: hypothetical protein WAO20_03100 [Acidobacteriota bacterium]